nr:MAG TPA: hypothetical protein [Caudoviricetes sp.]
MIASEVGGKGTGFRNPPCEMYKRKTSSVWRAFFD